MWWRPARTNTGRETPMPMYQSWLLDCLEDLLAHARCLETPCWMWSRPECRAWMPASTRIPSTAQSTEKGWDKKWRLNTVFLQANNGEWGTESILQGNTTKDEQGGAGRGHHIHDLWLLHGDVQQGLALGISNWVPWLAALNFHVKSQAKSNAKYHTGVNQYMLVPVMNYC